MSDLPHPRYYAATASTSAGTYLLGGYRTPSTSAFLAAGTMDWKEGPRLPLAMYEPCAARITATSFLDCAGVQFQ